MPPEDKSPALKGDSAKLKQAVHAAVASGLTQGDLLRELDRVIDDEYSEGGPERVKKAAEEAEKERKAKLTPAQLKAEEDAAKKAVEEADAARKAGKEAQAAAEAAAREKAKNAPQGAGARA